MNFDWRQSYPSQRQPIFARNVVATSQPLATQAGIAMLQRGGNAVDAALATAIALTVVEPCSNGLGSDLFAIVASGSEITGLNASGRAPAAWSPSRFAGKTGMPQRGWDTVTIPGAVSGWVALAQRYGTLPFADLFEPAIRYARDGYAVSPVVAQKWAAAVPLMPRGLGWHEHFLPQGRPPHIGERYASAAMASTLAKIAETRGEAFYRGELAQAMVAHANEHGSVHALSDFATHSMDWVMPLAQDYRDCTVHEIPPNGQGIAALMALGILQEFDVASHRADSVVAQHLQIEAMKLAFADAYRYVGDLRTMAVAPMALLDREYLRSRARSIDVTHAQNFGPGDPPRGGTVYLCAADQHGMMVSLIQSNYMGFGSGVVVPGTGISLQNRGAGFVLEPGHPNEVGGGKRPYHTIIPGFVTRDGSPYAAFGVMGGPIQPPGHVQTLVRLIDYRMNPQASLDAPRWKVNAGRSIDLESAASDELRSGLLALGHQMESVPDSYMDFGAGQMIVKTGAGYIAASDPRRDGQAAGF
ncbi:MAG: gamma-glutamyltransferase family protein [Casimicrobiaceae bacterium]